MTANYNIKILLVCYDELLVSSVCETSAYLIQRNVQAHFFFFNSSQYNQINTVRRESHISYHEMKQDFPHNCPIFVIMLYFLHHADNLHAMIMRVLRLLRRWWNPGLL